MIKPELQYLLKISIHKNQISSLFNEILKFPNFHLREIIEKPKQGYHRKEKSLIDDGKVMITQKIHEIEENLIYLFQNLEIDPDKISPPKKKDKYLLKVYTVEDLVDRLHEETDHEKYRLKGIINDIEKYSQKIQYYQTLSEMLGWLQSYNISSNIFSWFRQYKVKFGTSTESSFNDVKISLQNEDIPLVIEQKAIKNNNICFFIIYHIQNENKVNNIIEFAKVNIIDDIQEYLDNKGINLKKIEDDIQFCKERLIRAQSFIEEYKSNVPKYRAFLEILENTKTFFQIEEKFLVGSQNKIVKVEAFVPKYDQEKISLILVKKFGNAIRIIASPIERNDDSTTEVPSLVKIPKILKPFKVLVDLYGNPNYHEIDPTLFVAITYPIIFGLMFGDIGHGLVLIIVGLLMGLFASRNPEKKTRDFGFLFFWLGLGACLGGALYGEYFGNPLIINGELIVLLVNPMDNIIAVFKLAIYIGIFHLCLGWFLRMINYMINRRVFLAFVEPGAKICLLIGGSYLLFTHFFRFAEWFASPYPILFVIIPSIVLIIAKPIGKLIFRIKYLQKESTSELIGESIGDLGETFIGILSNVASYVRILALAMAHLGLMLIVVKVAEMVNISYIVPIILIFGNLLVIVLEGFLALIHTLRLHLYEFFGKFYTADGIQYTPIKISHEFSEIILGEK